jgi:N-acetylglutamate synthase-like GNAT family acetyltransferase
MIALATNQDIVEIVELFQKAKRQMEREHILQWNQEYPNSNIITQDILEKKCYKLVEKKEIVSVASIFQEKGVCWIKRFATNPAYTECGFASQLYQFLEKLGIDDQAEKIYSSTNNSNQKMQNFFLKQGFVRQSKYEEESRKSYGEFYIFCKRLEVDVNE